MAERDDIRLRQQVQEKASPGIRDRSKPVKGIDFGGLAGQASKKLSELDKVRKRAEEVSLSDSDNQMRTEYNISQSRLAVAKGQDAAEMSIKERERLNSVRDKIIASKPPHLRDEARIRLNKSGLPYGKFSLLHVSKENEAHASNVRQKELQLNTQSVLYSVGDDRAFEESLKAVKKSAMKISDASGQSKKLQEEDGLEAEGMAVIEAMKSASSSGDFDNAKKMFQRYQEKFVTPKQKIEAQNILGKAEKSNQSIQASTLAEQAMLNHSDPESIERYMRDNAANGEVFKEALPMMRSKLARRDKEETKDRKKRTARAINLINSGGSISEAKLIAPEEEYERIDKAYKAKQEGTSVTVSDPDVVKTLTMLMYDDEEAFVAEELDMYVGSDLSSKDFSRFQAYKDKIIQSKKSKIDKIENSTPKEVKDIIAILAKEKDFEDDTTFTTSAFEIYDDVADKFAKDGNTDRRALRKAFEKKLRAETFIKDDDGLPITRTEALEAIKNKESIAELTGRSNRIFSTDDLDDDDREAMETALEVELGRRPTPKELREHVDTIIIRKLRLEGFK